MKIQTEHKVESFFGFGIGHRIFIMLDALFVFSKIIHAISTLVGIQFNFKYKESQALKAFLLSVNTHYIHAQQEAYSFFFFFPFPSIYLLKWVNIDQIFPCSTAYMKIHTHTNRAHC